MDILLYVPRTALRDKGGAEFKLNKTFYTILLANPSLSQGPVIWVEAQPAGTHSQLESCSQRFLSERCLEWTPRRISPELLLFDISISHLDDGRERILTKFADSSKAGRMAGGTWDGIRIRNYLHALEWEEVRRRREGGRRRKKRERGNRKALYLRRRKNVSKYKMETKMANL